MEKRERFLLYENLYFHELERIEKVSARLSLPFTVMLAIIAFLAFMLNSESKPNDSGIATLCFWLLFSLSCIALLAGAWFFRLAWFGHDDKLLPVARTIEDYFLELEETYKDFEGGDKLTKKHFDDFLFDYYAQFASENAINNDRRSYNIYRSIVALMFSVLLAFAAAIPFYLHDNESGFYDKASTASSATQTP